MYLRIQVQTGLNEITKLIQPHIIDRIIAAVLGKSDTNLANVSPIKDAVLSKDQGGAPRKQDWNYRSVIVILNFLYNSIRPDSSYALHQYTRFSENPKSSHEKEVK